jgi:hypothetical protein
VGDVVTITGTTGAATHVVRYLAFGSVDFASDLVCGSADAGSVVEVRVFDPGLPFPGGTDAHATAGAGDTWCADFSAVSFDLVPGHGGWALTNGGGHTQLHWSTNHPPTANDNAYTTFEDVPLTVPTPGVLDNATDPDGHPLTAYLDFGPDHGTLTLNADGSFTYVPDADFNGVDVFGYFARDGFGGSDGALATITVDPVEDVTIDIKPGSWPNSINVDAVKSVVTAAILSTPDLDATSVDHTTLVFEGATETHVDKRSGEPARHEEDVDGDGDTDLVMHVRVGDTGLHEGSTEGTLTGSTFDGLPIQGTDAVVPIWTVASVTGSGHITWLGERRTMTFTAREFSDGTVHGEWQRYTRVTDAKAHGVVTCLTFDGNRAFLGGFTETTTSVPGGVYWAVEDNGEPGDDPADRITLQAFGLTTDQVSGFCATQDLTVVSPPGFLDIEEGNFTVRN